MGDHHNGAFEQPKGDETIFSVVETVVFKGEGKALEDLLCIDITSEQEQLQHRRERPLQLLHTQVVG